MTLDDQTVLKVYDHLCRVNGTWQPIGPNDIREILTAAIPFLTGVTVKKLEWFDGAAQTPFGEYTIQFDDDEEMHETPYCLGSPNDNLGHFSSEEAATAAAQADYEARFWSMAEVLGNSEQLETYYARQIEWSKKTFGPALRTLGILDHIRKELKEIEAEPHDLSEWIDVVILAMDGFWRHGGSVNDLMPLLLAKQTKNMARDWPDWRTMSENSAIEHDRSKDDEPSPRAQALEEAAILETLEECETYFENSSDADHDETGFVPNEEMRILVSVRAAIRSLSQPVSPAMGVERPVEGGCSNLEHFWRPISEADKSITFNQDFDLGNGEKMTVRNSDDYWVRDDDGRVYQATWTDHKSGYWWDIEGESPVDPVEYMPHPLSRPQTPGVAV